VKIGLVAVDGHSGFPNLALMRLSAWHKAQGDVVEWWNGFIHYDRVYLSKVFTFTPDVETVIDADEIITGGTGYKDYRSLPPEVEAMPPDYSLYPHFNRALGFMTRGCVHACHFCIVPRKEGALRPAATWEEIKRSDSREIVFLDNNVLASDFGLDQIARMGGKPRFCQAASSGLAEFDRARPLDGAVSTIWGGLQPGPGRPLYDAGSCPYAGTAPVDTVCPNVL